jgi:hypothetical protein
MHQPPEVEFSGIIRKRGWKILQFRGTYEFEPVEGPKPFHDEPL